MAFLDKVELNYLKLPLKNPFQISFGTQYYNESIILKLVTSEGLTGWGEIPVTFDPGYCYETVSTAEHILKDFIIPLIKKENSSSEPKTIDEWIEMYPLLIKDIRGHQFAKSGLDFCLWDLKSKIQKQPLADLLGATKNQIKVGISIGIDKNRNELVRNVENALQSNYARIKIKISPHNDIDVIKLLRKELGDFPLMVDANSAYTLQDIDTLQKFDRYDLMMIEQPLGYDDIIDHSILQKKMSTPICLDESIHSLEDVRKAYYIEACKIINLKPSRVGGITESLKIIDYCHENKLGLWCGGMLETGIGRIVNVAIQANEKFTLPGDTSPTQRFYKEDVIDPEVTMDSEGFVNVYQPYNILEDTIKRFSPKKFDLGLIM